jgi:NAD(P)-dependent dehydrogenase (short-subunit alcohol dehydrogenase family)
VVLITGTASGIGKATAEYLLEQGHIVYGGDIQFEKNRYLDGIGGHSLDMDVTQVDMVQAGVAQIIEEQGRIDVLVNNAGFGLYAPVEETTDEDARYQFEVNFWGVVNLTKAVLPHMRETRSGTIINISSMGGKIYMPLGAWYHGTKHAIEGWSDCLRLELKEFGIDVVIIEPGAINTNFGHVTASYMEKYIEGTAYGHFIDPFVEMTAVMDDPEAVADMSDEPIVIAKVINEAINAKNPKTRYVKGPMARTAILYRKWFGDRAFDDLIMQMVTPETRRSVHVGTNALAYFNDGYDVNVTYNTGLWRLGLSHSDMDHSSDDAFEDQRAGIGIYAGAFFLLAQTGLNLGLGFDYFYENTVNDIADDGTYQQSLDRDLYRAYLRVAWAKEIVRFSNVGLYLEPGLTTAYGFGDKDLLFDSGKVYKKVGFEITPFVSIGTKVFF